MISSNALPRGSMHSPGMPREPGVALTPLPEPGKTDYPHAVLEDAVAKGARVINAGGGESHQSFFQPAVLSPVDSSMRVYHEEQFGPLVPVVPYRDLQEVIDYVTASDYGQQLSIFGNDPAQVGRLVDAFVNGRAHQHQRPVPARTGQLSVQWSQEFRRGTLSVHDAPARVLHPYPGGDALQQANKELVDRIIRDRQSSFLTTDYIF